MKKLLLLAGAAALMAACADSATAPAPTPTRQVQPSKANHDVDCRSGYVVAYDQDGNPYCAPE